MMEPAPQGGVVVRSAPVGAGRRGRQGTAHDWDEIVDWHRQFPGTEVGYSYVPASLVPVLRKKYTDCDFRTWNVHLQDSPQRKSPTMVCMVFVRFPGAGDDDEASTD